LKDGIISLKMGSARAIMTGNTSVSGSLSIFPRPDQEGKGIGPSAFEVLIRNRKQEPTRTTNGTAIATSFGHDLDTSL